MAFQGLLLRYSGGGGNTNRDFALGGQVSLVKQGGIISPQSMALDSALAGVELCLSRGNPVGVGTLIWYPDTQELTWIPYGAVPSQSEAGPAPLLLQTLNMPMNEYPVERYSVKVAGDDYYEIGGSTKRLLVYVTVASLPATRQIRALTIADNDYSIFDAISNSENISGDTEYRCVYLHNMFIDDVWVRISITSQPANCTIELGNEAVGDPPWPLFLLWEDDVLDVGATKYLMGGYLEVNSPAVKSWEPMSQTTDFFEMHGFVQSEDGTQITDGTDGDVAPYLAGESDPTNVLASMLFGTSLPFNYSIAPGNMVSLWFKRVKTAGAVAPTTDTFQFKIEYYTEITDSPW